MMILERRAALLFRAALRRCLPDGTARRADTTPVLVRHARNGLLVHARDPDFALMYAPPGPPGKGVLAFPASALAAFEGRTDEKVELALTHPNKAVARWSERGAPRSCELPLIEPERVPVPPDLPRSFTPLPAEFPAAYHEASQTAARAGSRYALHRVLLKGKAGEVVASDATQLYARGGLCFPFREDVLVPPSAVFGLRDLWAGDGLAIGRTPTHVAVRCGPWAVALAIDEKGRYPDVASVIPRPAAAATRLAIDPEDADAFLNTLSKRLRGAAAREVAVTLDLTGPTPCLRFAAGGGVTEAALPHSEWSGAPVRLCLALERLLRLLELRFFDLEVADPDKPLAARDGARLFVVMTLPSKGALPPRADAAPAGSVRQAEPDAAGPPAVEPVSPPTLAPAGPAAAAAVVVLPPDRHLQPSEDESVDVLAEAEGLTSAVARAAEHAGRLLRFLRTVCARPKVVRAVRDSLLALCDRTPE